jgi:hypothetical protein
MHPLRIIDASQQPMNSVEQLMVTQMSLCVSRQQPLSCYAMQSALTCKLPPLPDARNRPEDTAAKLSAHVHGKQPIQTPCQAEQPRR